jgi:anthranilate phosphoribosyltransferase
MDKLDHPIPSTEHPFAHFIRILGKGKAGTRSLTQDEARSAFSMVLRGAVEPVQLGAFLMLLRVKEETPEELAGFVEASRDCLLAPPPGLRAEIDWSSYAGKKHQHPWFILAILLLAEAGHAVFIHGSGGHTPGRLYTEDALRQLRLPVATNWAQVGQQLNSDNLSYLPLEHFCPSLQSLIQLRPLFGLRSPVNTLTRMINPLRASASMQSVFHPAYARLHQETDLRLGQLRALVFKGDSGEVEIKPQADTRLCLLQDRQQQEILMPRALTYRVESVSSPSIEPVRSLWRDRSRDDYGLATTLATTAAALLVIVPGLDLKAAHQKALQMWESRRRSRLS